MEKVNSTDVMLAELIEQNNKQQKDVAAIKSSLEIFSGKMTELSNLLSTSLSPIKGEEMIPKKDAEVRAKFFIKAYIDLQAKYADLKADFGELQAKTRYWASNQWTKYLFRWLFIKRHLWFFIVFLVYGAMMVLLMCLNEQKHNENILLQEADLKYRYIRAKGISPIITNWVDSLFDANNPSDMEYIRKTVDEYESIIKQKCDSVVKAESLKRERYR